MSLGKRIKEARLKAGFSQEKTAELLGLSRQAVAKWESGRSAPSTANLLKLAALLQISVAELTGESMETETAATAVDQEIYTAAFLDAKRQLAAEQKMCRRKNMRMVALTMSGWLLLFLTGRILCTTYESPMTVMGWLFDASPYRSTYLFGWLTGHGIYLWSSALSIVPALFGKYRFSFCSLAGFTLGFVAGELFGEYPAGIPYGQGNYGWAIWGCIFLLSLLGGIVYEIIVRNRSEEK